MPFIETKTSAKLTEAARETLKQRLGEAISLIPGKSETWLMLSFQDKQPMYFRGNADGDTAFIDVKIFGQADGAAYDALTAALCDIYHDVLALDKERIYIRYEEGAHWGWNGANF